MRNAAKSGYRLVKPVKQRLALAGVWLGNAPMRG
jgi:hypothetical protein